MIRAAECPAPEHVGRQTGGDTCFPPRQDSPAVAAPAGPIARRPRIAAPSVLYTVRSSTAFAPRPRRDSLRGGGGLAVVLLLSSCRCRRQGFAVRGETPGYPLFFFNDTATTEIYPLSLHDALPI